MTTRKIIFTIVGTLLALGLLVLIFVGGLVGFAFYSIGHSEAAITAKSFLKKNEILKKDIGEVKDFGMFITGNVKAENSDGAATLGLKVIGEKKTVNAWVLMEYRNGKSWNVTSANYKDDTGKTVELVDKFGPSSVRDDTVNQ